MIGCPGWPGTEGMWDIQVLALGMSWQNQEELVTLTIAGGLTKLHQRSSCPGTRSVPECLVEQYVLTPYRFS